LSYLADTQTDREINKVWQKYNLLGGGNYRTAEVVKRAVTLLNHA